MIVRTPPAAPGALSQQAGAIRALCSSAGLASPVVNKLHWVLANSCGVIWSQGFPSSSLTDLDSRIYHRPSPNATAIGVVALISHADQGGGSLTITADDGAGDSATFSTYQTTGSDRFAEGAEWQLWVATIDLADTDYQYHTVVSSDLYVRKCLVLELPRAALDTALDYCTDWRSGAHSGYLPGRMITESTATGIGSLIDLSATAVNQGKRHVNVILPSTDWSHTEIVSDSPPADSGWVTGAPSAYGTFAFPHQARTIKASDSLQSYTCRMSGYVSGGLLDTFYLRLRSSGTADTAASSSSTETTETFLDCGSLDVDAQSVDSIYPEVRTVTGSTATVVLRSWHLAEEDFAE